MIKPVRCSNCGLRCANDHMVRWLGENWENRFPFCLECAPAEERRLLALGV